MADRKSILEAVDWIVESLASGVEICDSKYLSDVLVAAKEYALQLEDMDLVIDDSWPLLNEAMKIKDRHKMGRFLAQVRYDVYDQALDEFRQQLEKPNDSV